MVIGVLQEARVDFWRAAPSGTEHLVAQCHDGLPGTRKIAQLKRDRAAAIRFDSTATSSPARRARKATGVSVHTIERLA
jgi:hypothetical protein